MAVIALQAGELTAYLTVNNDDYRRGVEQARGDMDKLAADAKRSGDSLGSSTSRMVSAVSSSVAKLATDVQKAYQKQADAAGAVTLAELRLKEARDKGGKSASALLALEQRLTTAQRNYAAATLASANATNQHSAALGRLGDQAKGVEKAGEEVGGRLAEGINAGLTRAAPLIVAGIAAALTTGAPGALAAAGILFGGIATVAAAQSDVVQSAWLGTWDQIKTVATDAARGTVPAFVAMADQVSAAFTKMGPQIEQAFHAAVPLMDTLVTSILQASQNAFPGLIKAVQAAGPVFDGLGAFIEKVGTGLGEFFSILSEHSGAAGQVFSQLGDTMATLLPLLAELLGQGAELASNVLPLLNGSLSLVLAAVKALGPALPIVVAGFAAMKIAQSAVGWLDGFAVKLGQIATSGGAFSGVAGKMSSGIGAIASAAGPAAAAVGFMAAEVYAWQQAAEKAEAIQVALGRAMEVGGSQAAGAAAYLDRFTTANQLLETGLGTTIGSMSFLGTSIADLIPNAQSAADAYDTWYQSLDPLAQAQEDVAVASEKLSQAVADHGPKSREAAAAADELAAAEAEVAQMAADEEMAIRGVTEAMIAQTDAVLAAANADLAHRQALEAAGDGYVAMNEAIRDHGAASEEAGDAALAWESDLLRVVAAAGTLAEDALPAAMDAEDRHAASQLAQLDQLRLLENMYGDALPQGIRDMIAELEQSTKGYDEAALQAAALAAEAKTTQGALEGLGAMRPTPVIDADDKGLKAKQLGALASLQQLAAQRPTPTLDADGNPIKSKVDASLQDLFNLGKQRPMPVVDLDDKVLKSKQLGALAGLQALGAQRPTPVASINDSALVGGVAKSKAMTLDLNNQRPTPIASLNGIPFLGTAGALAVRMSQINAMRASPWATLYASTGAAEGALNYTARNRYSYVTQYVRQVLSGVPLFANGGLVAPIKAAGGRIVGPGGPRDDLVPALGPDGAPWRLSNGEWVINALRSAQQGFGKMAALNSGQADIVLRNEPRVTPIGAANGASLADTLSGRSGGAAIQIGKIVIEGTFDLASSRDLDRAVSVFRDRLVNLERAGR